MTFKAQGAIHGKPWASQRQAMGRVGWPTGLPRQKGVQSRDAGCRKGVAIWGGIISTNTQQHFQPSQVPNTTVQMCPIWHGDTGSWHRNEGHTVTQHMHRVTAKDWCCTLTFDPGCYPKTNIATTKAGLIDWMLWSRSISGEPHPTHNHQHHSVTAASLTSAAVAAKAIETKPSFMLRKW